ncbi:DUF3100 domain-containing protein [Leucobacter sp. wl10]|nr:DUF3100 domain-containing protein [Leucobacter sp. wl10]
MQLIGALNIDVGIGSIVIFPMVWGLIAGLLVSVQRFKPLGIDLQKAASALVAVAVLVLVGRLAFNIGPSLMMLVNAGPALLLQEIGHLLGTVVLALPLAVLLRMGTSTIGATFSLDREPSFAIVSEKYGPDSHQYRGVLSMYVFGTLFGAVFITLLTSLVANWGVFDPLALAMGAGVGSGSMMAASAGVIAAAYPGQAEAILAMASVSNLITTLLGVYVGIWIALPLADKFYHFLTRGKHKQEIADAEAAAADTAAGAAESAFEPGRGGATGEISTEEAEKNRQLIAAIKDSTSTVSIPLRLSIPIIGVLGMVTALIAAKSFDWRVIVGYLVLIALTLIGIGLAKLTKQKVAAVLWVTTIGAYVSSPWFFGADWLVEQVSSIDVLSVATVMLSLAGLSLGKDLPLLKNIGWKIIPVGLVAITASFLLSAVIAEFALGFWG